MFVIFMTPCQASSNKSARGKNKSYWLRLRKIETYCSIKLVFVGYTAISIKSARDNLEIWENGTKHTEPFSQVVPTKPLEMAARNFQRQPFSKIVVNTSSIPHKKKRTYSSFAVFTSDKNKHKGNISAFLLLVIVFVPMLSTSMNCACAYEAKTSLNGSFDKHDLWHPQRISALSVFTFHVPFVCNSFDSQSVLLLFETQQEPLGKL